MKFSVLLSVYSKESSDHLDNALESIINQTILPNEVVLVKDGILSAELEAVITRYETRNANLFNIVSISENVGLGDALNEGLKYCSYDAVARMDTDDICIPNRFEIQLNYLKHHHEVAVVGGYIEEFTSIPGDLKRIKRVPLEANQIKHYARKRNPLNHPSVMFRKKAIESVGGYERILFFEDYYLWLKLLGAGYKLANIDQVLLYFRVGNDMIGRRHGYAYAVHEFQFAKKARKANLFTSPDAFRFISTRLPLRLISKKLLSTFYKRIIRK